MLGFFNRAQGFNIEKFQVVNGHPSANALEKLEALIAPEALHDSAERCDAPKCDPETRVAVQDDLYRWIEHGDANNPHNMKWVTGPASSGKTAVMGSIVERCRRNGFPAISFFFSSTGSIRRRTKTAFVTTVAYQLAQHGQDLKDAITAAIEADAIVFKKHLHAQMETLVLSPLRAVAGVSNTALRGVIVIDGLDECRVEEIHDNTTDESRPESIRTKEQDQLEILHVLSRASSYPGFPFRIIISSRPEPVIRHFFNSESHPVPIAQTMIDLHNDYNAEADITRILEAYFIRLCRQHKLPPSWLPPNAVKILADRASGRFDYVGAMIGVFEKCHEEPFPHFLRLMPPRIFDRTRDFSIDDLHVFHGHPSANAFEKLEALIAPEALHDSAERADAPRCHPETRVAVQDDLYSWIEDGDAINPSNMKWVTGPAGVGKTAVMGSITERCNSKGLEVISFFFSSTGSIGCRTKTAFVTTIAYQLAQHRQDLKDVITAAIEANTNVFKENLHAQMETLILSPLRAVAGVSNTTFRGVIVVDGLDGCEVEGIHDNTTTRSRPQSTPTKEQDQLEILHVLSRASSDPGFPFRIIISSRPEPVIRHFFNSEGHPVPIAQTLDLHKDYSAEADIALVLEAYFIQHRRRYDLPPSWTPPSFVKILVDRASTRRFSYVANVIRSFEENQARGSLKTGASDGFRRAEFGTRIMKFLGFN